MIARSLTIAAASGMLLLGACRTTAPLNTWAPPRLHSTVGRSVAVATIVGDPAVSDQLHQAFQAARPQDLTRHVRLIEQAELQRRSAIQLASVAENTPSDLAMLSAARREGIDFLLLGEILERRGGPVPEADEDVEEEDVEDAKEATEAPTADAADRLTVSWRLIDVGHSRVLGGLPVTVTTESAARLHPDLAMLNLAAESLLSTAAARESWRLFAPHVRKHSVELAKPFLAPGSAEVRLGNSYAAALRWEDAERHWQAVVDRHPRNHAAIHNLALATAARQDFETAKKLAQRALEIHSSTRYERTVVWIESQQQDLVESFDLPLPPEGWLFAPDNPAATADRSRVSPPRWTWWTWLTQPIPLP